MSLSPHDDLPTLVVVGRANAGKSTLVATLTESADIRISDLPGTTTETRAFLVRAADTPLLRIIDTPGFEDAKGALHLMEQAHRRGEARPTAVRTFIEETQGDESWQPERRLLEPILAGGAILYIADASTPWRSNQEAELKILQWTGQPRIALINRTGSGDYGEAWRAQLDPYFSLVRTISAHNASWEERVDLIRSLGVLRESWREPIARVVAALDAVRARRRAGSAELIAELLMQALTHTRQERVQDREHLAADRERIELAFQEDIIGLETRTRARIESLYGYGRLVSDQEDGGIPRPELGSDLFDEETWSLHGLSTGQLVTSGAIGGALTGGALDAMVGGASFGAGALLGGLVGAGAAAFYKRDAIAKATLEQGLAGRIALPEGLRRRAESQTVLRVGPHRGANFPWVLISRALNHWHAVEQRTHAQQGALRLSERLLSASDLPEEHRKQLGWAIEQVRKERGTAETRKNELRAALLRCFEDAAVQKLFLASSAART